MGAVIKSETIHGKTYILSDSLEIWRIDFGYDGKPTMQMIDRIERGQVDSFTRPLFARWMDK